MTLLAYLYRQSWKLVLLATLSGLVAGVSGAALIAVISQGIAAETPSGTLAWAFFAIATLHLLTKCGTEISLLHLTQAAIYQMRIELGRKILTTSQKRLQALGKPGILVLLTKDIDSFTEAFIWLPIAFGNAIIILACFAYLAWLSPLALLLLIVFLVLGLLAFFAVERIPRRHLIEVRAKMEALYGHFHHLIEGSKELQLNAGRGQQFVERIIAHEARAFRTSYTHAMTGYNMAVNVGAIMFFVLIGTLLFLVPQALPQAPEVVATTIFTLLYLVRPVAELVFALPVVSQAGIAFGRIRQLDQELGTPDGAVPGLPVPVTSAAAASAAPLAGGAWQLTLQDIRHHYPGSDEDRQFVLGPLDLTINAGEILYIVGGNGSGKTTLAMLILGLYQPDEGRILLDGREITADNIDTYRQNFSAVFADFHLFEQVLDADGGTLDARVQHYLEVLGMAHKVRVVDGRYTTLNLSTGQRKRLALVSAYLEDRPIYLFDEWAADQDPVFKRVFYTELLPELKSRGKAVIVITHDDAYFSCADRIFKLEDGHCRPI
ncbi:MAG: cyclic peptide export ABC transporter [Sterolibacterium sp.]|nr:cyclic peptide export ABC transporter [Sterolibacterium sp.]